MRLSDEYSDEGVLLKKVEGTDYLTLTIDGTNNFKLLKLFYP